MSKLYNLSTIKELSEDDPEFIKAMVDTFIEEIPQDLEQLALGVVEDDREMVHEYAHKMKPTVEMFGLSCHYDVLVMEAWGKSDDQMDINEHFMRVQEDLQKTVTQLKEDF
ncbi:Hpt domain-containing protein [Nonlabens sp. Hel1_33_55]|uniref:Hpt domain-containing protein n=1 Tax=Nonlabens sp. Hel1_33_55 TaxID=1336802 RepID=UPI000875E7F5|nr:Hpt domain-containing protein [Nonlabens sp. Hel1_33_55]SCX91655.1 Hpt domain-containing protein [Nonlabens sp. Hel1_33_55]